MVSKVNDSNNDKLDKKLKSMSLKKDFMVRFFKVTGNFIGGGTVRSSKQLLPIYNF